MPLRPSRSSARAYERLPASAIYPNREIAHEPTRHINSGSELLLIDAKRPHIAKPRGANDARTGDTGSMRFEREHLRPAIEGMRKHLSKRRLMGKITCADGELSTKEAGKHD